MPLSIVYRPRTRRDLRRLDRPIRECIIAAIERFATDGSGDVLPLTGRPDTYRLRVGDWRVLFTVDYDAGVMTVLRIAHRSAAYR